MIWCNFIWHDLVLISSKYVQNLKFHNPSETPRVFWQTDNPSPCACGRGSQQGALPCCTRWQTDVCIAAICGANTAHENREMLCYHTCSCRIIHYHHYLRLKGNSAYEDLSYIVPDSQAVNDWWLQDVTKLCMDWVSLSGENKKIEGPWNGKALTSNQFCKIKRSTVQKVTEGFQNTSTKQQKQKTKTCENNKLGDYQKYTHRYANDSKLLQTIANQRIANAHL